MSARIKLFITNSTYHFWHDEGEQHYYMNDHEISKEEFYILMIYNQYEEYYNRSMSVKYQESELNDVEYFIKEDQKKLLDQWYKGEFKLEL